MDRDFEFNGTKFKLGKIDPFKQFHIVRRIGPILADVITAMQTSGKKLEALSENERLTVVAKLLSPVFTGLSALSDEDSEKVLKGLLEAVEMQQPAGNWAKIVSGGILMFQDMELPVLIHAAVKAFMFNLSGFFNVLPQK